MQENLEQKTDKAIQTYRPKKHWLRNTIVGAAFLVSAAMYGDAKNVNSIKVNNISLESIYWSGTPASEGTPSDYHNFKTKVEVDENGMATLYFGNIRTDKFLPVHEDGTVGSFSDNKKYQLGKFGENMMEKLDEIKQSEPYQETTKTLKSWYDRAKDKLSDWMNDEETP